MHATRSSTIQWSTMYGYQALTHVILVLEVISFSSAMAFLVCYNVRQKNRLKEMERNGFRPHSKAEAIIAEQQGLRSRR